MSIPCLIYRLEFWFNHKELNELICASILFGTRNCMKEQCM